MSYNIIAFVFPYLRCKSTTYFSHEQIFFLFYAKKRKSLHNSKKKSYLCTLLQIDMALWQKFLL